MYPAMQKPKQFFNLSINDASLLLVSIGMTLVILAGDIDVSVGGIIGIQSLFYMRSSAGFGRSRASAFRLPRLFRWGKSKAQVSDTL